jgi:hypothetical protein
LSHGLADGGRDWPARQGVPALDQHMPHDAERRWLHSYGGGAFMEAFVLGSERGKRDVDNGLTHHEGP